MTELHPLRVELLRPSQEHPGPVLYPEHIIGLRAPSLRLQTCIPLITRWTQWLIGILCD